ncbi:MULTISPECIES: porphobilinogen synthase [Halanaerobium]|jgi:porphobilinogen synthase|uniref:Delta-aminolevulinic acid dehydratase n=1 Tax=Halanaerobium congolense TaxID=54121 RepID=A0A1G6KZH6_9FIRM|nr:MULTISPECIES: porphobilinogen synthase [Halanaerobium]OEG63687.1 MAG: delta-aminolevulinic acid dehydratase [Halanaerobium sp. MDAL1]PTX15404.1 porphobilinogen synthase [Halanaerobium congolense]PUU89797.1 MAG: porphobilinogen synthase [Halanaerobium sp.]PUU91787.1 MAG: porphobilinogen synthase [Halanaerobium sp.]PXV68216.1 porphobilinogen synthase [Halanaerobium congolense]
MNLKKRPRRLRSSKNIRDLVKETRLSAADFVKPLFVVHGKNIRKEIPSMPDNYHLSLDQLEKEIENLIALGIRGIILFGLPKYKDQEGSSAWQQDGIVQQAVRQIKEKFSDFLVITDLCMCQYTDHGHCGILKNGEIKNDATLSRLAKIAISHAEAGADMIAPSDMMDGRVGKIREALDQNGFKEVAIMAYSAKYHSAFYGPFRDAAHSAPGEGDRSSYQMDAANSDEALREMELDIEEGADIIMVKPALSYLDIIQRASDNFNMPIAAYNVSGEYAMVKAAAEKGWIDEKSVALEILTSIKRAGADIIITYWADNAVQWLNEK